jgi:hypothetical protein
MFHADLGVYSPFTKWDAPSTRGINNLLVFQPPKNGDFTGKPGGTGILWDRGYVSPRWMDIEWENHGDTLLGHQVPVPSVKIT